MSLRLLRPSPDDPAHAKLLDDVMIHIKNRNYRLVQTFYAGVNDLQSQELLKKQTDPTAQFLRTKKDAFILPENNSGPTLIVDAKTHSKNSKYHDATFEAFPYLIAVMNAKFYKTKTIYVYRDEDSGYDKGWIAHPNFCIPNRVYLVELEKNKLINPIISEILAGLKKDHGWEPWVASLGATYGSGDSFICINEDHLKTLYSWQELIDKIIKIGGDFDSHPELFTPDDLFGVI